MDFSGENSLTDKHLKPVGLYLCDSTFGEVKPAVPSYMDLRQVFLVPLNYYSLKPAPLAVVMGGDEIRWVLSPFSQNANFCLAFNTATLLRRNFLFFYYVYCIAGYLSRSIERRNPFERGEVSVLLIDQGVFSSGSSLRGGYGKSVIISC